MRSTIVLLALGVLPLAAQRQPLPRDLRDPSTNLAPYVTSPQPIVDRMLDMAGVKQGETVYDLGCGDGRILITAVQKYRAKGVGIELSPRLVKMTLETLKRLNLDSEISIREGNLLEADFSGADVVTLYLETGSNELLRPRLEKYLKAGARVVSHDFEVRGWKASKVDKIYAFNRNHTIYLYEVPAAFGRKK